MADIMVRVTSVRPRLNQQLHRLHKIFARFLLTTSNQQRGPTILVHRIHIRASLGDDDGLMVQTTVKIRLMMKLGRDDGLKAQTNVTPADNGGRATTTLSARTRYAGTHR